ncbi:MAG: hypothetical protein SGJ23_12445 [Alphaproteobacteria bacterium]|nr:hypothetical protein [Alphaproteobacteria bacterium]
MRVLAAAVVMAVLAGCATTPSARESAALAPSVVAEARAQRRSQQELLAAYWAERRAPRVLMASDFTPVDFTAALSARSLTIGQNFPESSDSEDQSRLNEERLERESAATREAVRAAIRR